MLPIACRKRFTTAIAGAALASALVVSGSHADEGYQDLRSPDAVDAARTAGDPPEVAPPPSSIAASAGETYEDLRSPDARDAAEDYRPTLDSRPAFDEPSEPGGFDWVSALIGAAAAAGVGLVLMATVGLRRPTRRGAARA